MPKFPVTLDSQLVYANIAEVDLMSVKPIIELQYEIHGLGNKVLR